MLPASLALSVCVFREKKIREQDARFHVVLGRNSLDCKRRGHVNYFCMNGKMLVNASHRAEAQLLREFSAENACAAHIARNNRRDLRTGEYRANIVHLEHSIFTPGVYLRTFSFSCHRHNTKKRKPPAFMRFALLRSGWGGIRTHGRFPFGGFQDRCIQPLCHPS